MAEQVKLYGFWASPLSCRVEIALKLKGVPYEYIEEDLYNKSPSLLKYNPVHQKVPVLVHNEKPIAESLVILEYIDETWKKNPILPQDPHQRDLARFWAKFIDEKESRLIRAVNEREKVMEEMHQLMKILEGALSGKDFFGGTEEKFPVLYKWIGKLKGLDVVNECIPPIDEYLAYVKARIEALKLASAAK